jgi:uncharacterized protein (DUF2236 family)
MLWVHATLVEASLAAHTRFVGRLGPDEEEAYYREMGLVARLFGLPSSALPARLAEFREYMDAQLAGQEICVTAPAREVAAVILEARLPAPLRVLVPAHRLATAALLPASLREEYGLHWSRAHALPLVLAARSLRLLAVPLLRTAGRVSRPKEPLSKWRLESSGPAGATRGGVLRRARIYDRYERTLRPGLAPPIASRRRSPIPK